MRQEHVLTGRDFNEIIENTAKVSSNEDAKRPPSGVYIGFSASSRTQTVYRARFDASAIKLCGNQISGMFEHCIYKREDIMGDPKKLAKECFEGIWFADEGRMLVRGTKWAEGSMHKELGIFKEHYDFFFKDDTMVGNWASGGKPGEPKLNDEAKFDQPMFLQHIPESVSRMSEERIAMYLAERNKCNVDHAFTLLDSVSTGMIRKVKVVLKMEAITGIEQISQTFGAFFLVTFEWSPSMKDVYYLISGGNDDNWIPDWMPPTPFLVNRSQHTEEITESNPEAFEKEGGGFVIRKTFTFNSILLESLELDKYPFDVQEFQIKMKIPDCKNVLFDVLPDLSKEVASQLEDLTESSEWEPCINHINVAKEEYGDGNFSFILVLRMKRTWSIYFWRIIFVMALISICSGFIVVIDPADDFGDILGFLVTLFLAALAYSIVIAGYLPHLKYLTVLDKYIIFTFFFICGLMAADVLMVNYSHEDDMKDNQYTIVKIFYGFWVVWHICFFLYTWHCRQVEMKKLKKA